MIYKKTFVMNLAIFICWFVLVALGIYWSWNPLQVYEFSFLSLLVLLLYLAVIFTPALSALALFKENNKKLSLTAIGLNYILVIYFSVFFLYIQTLPNNMIRKEYEPLITVLLLISALPASISIKSLIRLLKK
jgi:hypothetical protein